MKMEAVKAVFIHRQHDCLYKKSNITYKNLLDLQSEFSKVVGFKINIKALGINSSKNKIKNRKKFKCHL